MDANGLIPSLALFTLLAVLLLAVVGFLLFKRKPANQHPMEKSPDGAIVREQDTGLPPPPVLKSTDELQDPPGKNP